MKFLIALVLGVLAYMVAHLVFNQPISALIGVVVAGTVLLGDSYRTRV